MVKAAPMAVIGVLCTYGLKMSVTLKQGWMFRSTFLMILATVMYEIMLFSMNIDRKRWERSLYAQCITATIHIGLPIGAVYLVHALDFAAYQKTAFVVSDIFSYIYSKEVFNNSSVRPMDIHNEKLQTGKERLKAYIAYFLMSFIASIVALTCWYFPVLNIQINFQELITGTFLSQLAVQITFSVIITAVQLMQIKVLENFTRSDEYEGSCVTMMYSYLMFSMPSKVIRLYGGNTSVEADIYYWLLVVGSFIFNKGLPRIIGLLVYQRHLVSKILKVDVEQKQRVSECSDRNEKAKPSALLWNAADDHQGESEERISTANVSQTETYREENSKEEEEQEMLASPIPEQEETDVDHGKADASHQTEKIMTISFDQDLPLPPVSSTSESPPIKKERRTTIRFTDDTIILTKSSLINEPSDSTMSGYSIDLEQGTLNPTGKKVLRRRKSLKFDLEMYSRYIEDQALVDLLSIFFASGFVYVYSDEIHGPSDDANVFVHYSPLWRIIPILILHITFEVILCKIEAQFGATLYNGKRIQFTYLTMVLCAAVSSGLWIAVGLYGLTK
ncbi:hypothetical protein HDU97_000542 [Phlyctochytrium planicorne]|nr:hypothetical protein HDU97_000542 [Phlyctochytrium planicorne]